MIVYCIDGNKAKSKKDTGRETFYAYCKSRKKRKESKAE